MCYARRTGGKTATCGAQLGVADDTSHMQFKPLHILFSGLQDSLYSHATANLKTLRVATKLSRARLALQSNIVNTAPPLRRTQIRVYSPATCIGVRMASTGLEDSLKNLSLIQSSYPQAKDTGDDPAKLSSAIFPSVEVGTRAIPPVASNKTSDG